MAAAEAAAGRAGPTGDARTGVPTGGRTTSDAADTTTEAAGRAASQAAPAVATGPCRAAGATRSKATEAIEHIEAHAGTRGASGGPRPASYAPRATDTGLPTHATTARDVSRALRVHTDARDARRAVTPKRAWIGDVWPRARDDVVTSAADTGATVGRRDVGGRWYRPTQRHERNQ